ncbi:MAG: M23 family metallopeptidase [Hyphomonadaceae bacterium]
MLAPFDATVVRININPVVNVPGQLGRPPASFIVFERADGMRVLFAHVQDVQVEQGATVTAGQVVAHVGNNGYGRSPHIHVGAWKGETPYQIRWDLRSSAEPR